MHSPEPWTRHIEDTELPLGGSSVKGPVGIVDANREAVVPDTPWCPTGYDMERIVACVNALAGVQDPAAFMREVHSLVCAVKSSRLLTTPHLQALCDKVLEHREMEIPT